MIWVKVILFDKDHRASLTTLHDTRTVGVDILQIKCSSKRNNSNDHCIITWSGTHASTHAPRLSGQTFITFLDSLLDTFGISFKAAGVDNVDVGGTRRRVVPFLIECSLDGGCGVVDISCNLVVEDLENVENDCRPLFLFCVVGLVVVNIWKGEEVAEDDIVDATDFVTDFWSVSKLSRIVFTIIDGSVVVVAVVVVILGLLLDLADGFLLILFAWNNFRIFVLFDCRLKVFWFWFLGFFLFLFLFILGRFKEFSILWLPSFLGTWTSLVLVSLGGRSKSGMTIETPPILIVTGADVEVKALSVALGVKDDVLLCCLLLGSMLILERLLVVPTLFSVLDSTTFSDLDASLKVYPNLHISGSLQRFLACSTLKKWKCMFSETSCKFSQKSISPHSKLDIFTCRPNMGQ